MADSMPLFLLLGAVASITTASAALGLTASPEGVVYLLLEFCCVCREDMLNQIPRMTSDFSLREKFEHRFDVDSTGFGLCVSLICLHFHHSDFELVAPCVSHAWTRFVMTRSGTSV